MADKPVKKPTGSKPTNPVSDKKPSQRPKPNKRGK